MTFASDMDIDYVFLYLTIEPPPLYPLLNNPVEHFLFSI